MDGSLALNQPQTIEGVIADDMHVASLQAFLFGTLATLALILAAVGFYGIMSYLAMLRTREIGMLVGATAALALTRAISSLFYGISAADPFTFVCVATLLALVALAAYFIPAPRATKIDPMLALRCE